MNRQNNPEMATNPKLRRLLYYLGGIAALLAVFVFRRNLGAELMAFHGFGLIDTPEAIPDRALDWFTLLQQNTLAGLMLLEVFDLVEYALVGLVFWPGALYYVTYNYLAYAIAVPFNWPVVLYAVLVVLSLYTIVRLLGSVDAAVVRQRLLGAVAERFSGSVLVGFGLLFLALQVSKVVQGLTGQAALSAGDLAMAVTDIVLIPTRVAGGILLFRRQQLGYLTGAGLLFQASMLFIGLLVFFLLQPLVAGIPFSVGDFLVILVMGMICFVPFGLFVRGILLEGRR